MNLWIVSINADPRFSTYGLHGGGQGGFVRTLTKELPRLGWAIKVITSSAGSYGYKFDFPILPAVEDLGEPDSPHISEHGANDDDKYLLATIDCLSVSEPPSLILGCHSLSWPIVNSIARQVRCPIVYSMCSTEQERSTGIFVTDPSRRERENEIVRRSSLLIASSNEERNMLLDYYDAKDEKVTVIQRPIDTDLFIPYSKPAKFRVLFIGRPTKQKGLDVFLQTINITRDDDIHFTIVGCTTADICNSPELSQYSHVLSDRRLTVLGPVAHGEVPDILGEHRILVMPSRYETYGNLAVEAMACGLPVIATSVGALREHIKESSAGISVPPNDAFQVSESILKIKCSPLMETKFRSNGPIYAAQFEKQITVRKISNALKLNLEQI